MKGDMTTETKSLFKHRKKADGSIDTICLACLSTISNEMTEAALERDEAEHVCKYAIPARRSGRLPEGMTVGRRQSDAEWERLRTRKD
jgi:hypothetical protein